MRLTLNARKNGTYLSISNSNLREGKLSFPFRRLSKARMLIEVSLAIQRTVEMARRIS